MPALLSVCLPVKILSLQLYEEVLQHGAAQPGQCDQGQGLAPPDGMSRATATGEREQEGTGATQGS